MQESVRQVFLPIVAIHGPQCSTFLAAVLRTAFGITVALLNGSRLWELWTRQRPRTGLRGQLCHDKIFQVRGNLGLVRRLAVVLASWAKKHVQPICGTKAGTETTRNGLGTKNLFRVCDAVSNQKLVPGNSCDGGESFSPFDPTGTIWNCKF